MMACLSLGDAVVPPAALGQANVLPCQVEKVVSADVSTPLYVEGDRDHVVSGRQETSPHVETSRFLAAWRKPRTLRPSSSWSEESTIMAEAKGDGVSKGLASPQKVLFPAHERYNLSIQWETIQSKNLKGEEGLPE